MSEDKASGAALARRSIAVPADLWADFQARCRDQDTNASRELRRLIRGYLERTGGDSR